MNDRTLLGIQALKAGDKAQARQHLVMAIRQDSKDVTAWLAMSLAVDKREEQQFCLEQVLKLDPENQAAQKRLARLTPEPASPRLTEPDRPSSPEPEPALQAPVAETRPEPELSKPLPEPKPQPQETRRLFSGIYLPRQLVLFALLVIFTDMALTLIGQPQLYWIDHQWATEPVGWLQQWLVASPWLFAGIGLAYLAVSGLLLWLLPRFLGLPLWFLLCFLHLGRSVGWSRQIIATQFSLSAGSEKGFEVTLVVLGGLVLGVVLAYAFFSRQGLLDQPRPLGRRIGIVMGGWFLVMVTGLVWTQQMPATTWVEIDVVDRPGPRASAAIAYDTRRNVAVLFGGASAWLDGEYVVENDTWEWNGEGWEQKFPAVSPPGRIVSDMAYDEVRGVVVMFGGYDAAGAKRDVWEWDGANWTERTPADGPEAREGHQLWFDTQLERIILYGGFDHESIFFDDVWAWNGTQWQAIQPDPPSPVASAYSSAYDRLHQRNVIFAAGFPQSTWIAQGDRWIDPELAVEPPSRSVAAMAYNGQEEVVVLFGGFTEQQFLDDTWIFREDEWTQLSPIESPNARWGHNMFYDPTRRRVVLFGGFDRESYRNDMWELILDE